MHVAGILEPKEYLAVLCDASTEIPMAVYESLRDVDLLVVAYVLRGILESSYPMDLRFSRVLAVRPDAVGPAQNILADVLERRHIVDEGRIALLAQAVLEAASESERPILTSDFLGQLARIASNSSLCTALLHRFSGRLHAADQLGVNEAFRSA